MKYILVACMKPVLLILVLVPLMVSAQKSLSLTGKISGLNDGSPVTLVDLNNPADTIAKGFVRAGSFNLKGKLAEPMLVTLNFINKKRLVLFLDNANVNISGSVDDLKSVKTSGSPSQAAFNVFQNKFNPLFEKFGKSSQQMQRWPSDSLNLSINNTKIEIEQEIDLFLKKYNTSVVSSFLLAATFQLSDDINLTEKRLNSLKPAAANNFYGNYLRQTIADARIGAIGSEAMDFVQTDTLGIPVSLSSFRGKYVLLDFWASWCGPCRQENPNVVQTFNKFKEKNFTVLGVSLDRPGQKEKWLQAIHADNLTWTHVSDLQFWSNAVAKQYRIESIPQNYLIDPDGKIVAKNLRGPALGSKLCEVLGCN